MPRGKLENIGIPTLDEDVFVSDRKKSGRSYRESDRNTDP